MKTLRASGLYINADVTIGENEYGSDVTVSLKLSRKDPEVIEALAPLQKLLQERAMSFVVGSAIDKRVAEGVRAKVKDATAKEKERLAKKKDAEVAAATKAAEARASQAEQDARWATDRTKRMEEDRDRYSEQLKNEREVIRQLRAELDAARQASA